MKSNKKGKAEERQAKVSQPIGLDLSTWRQYCRTECATLHCWRAGLTEYLSPGFRHYDTEWEVEEKRHSLFYFKDPLSALAIIDPYRLKAFKINSIPEILKILTDLQNLYHFIPRKNDDKQNEKLGYLQVEYLFAFAKQGMPDYYNKDSYFKINKDSLINMYTSMIETLALAIKNDIERLDRIVYKHFKMTSNPLETLVSDKDKRNVAAILSFTCKQCPEESLHLARFYFSEAWVTKGACGITPLHHLMTILKTPKADFNDFLQLPIIQKGLLEKDDFGLTPMDCLLLFNPDPCSMMRLLLKSLSLNVLAQSTQNRQFDCLPSGSWLNKSNTLGPIEQAYGKKLHARFRKAENWFDLVWFNKFLWSNNTREEHYSTILKDVKQCLPTTSHEKEGKLIVSKVSKEKQKAMEEYENDMFQL